MNEPLAQRLRPKTLAEVCGQQHLLAPGRVFRRTIESGKIPNMIFYGPSGTGKDTVVAALLKKHPEIQHTVSATTRAPRDGEKDGINYHFMTVADFEDHLAHDQIVEHTKYCENYYGTLRSEVERIWAKGHVIVFDVDVVGGINLKRIFGDDACSVFIMPPSVEELRRRLEGRGTDAPEVIDRRVAKAEFELTKAPEFDHVVVNDCLDEAVCGTCSILDQFIAR